MKIKMKSWQKNFLLITVSTLFALISAEVALRVFNPHELYFSSVPKIELDRDNKFHQFFNIDSSYHYSVNEFGYRSPSFFAKDRYGILTVGGSTTDCIGLADTETWPWLLEEQLNRSFVDQKFTVGNIGVPAFNTFHHVLQVEHIAPQFKNIKMVVLLVGINDFSRFLHLEKEALIPNEKELLHQTFVRHPRKVNEKWFERTELWCHIRDFSNHFRKMYQVDNKNFDLSSMMTKYDSAVKVDALPDLRYGIEIMLKNIVKINEFCNSEKIKLVVITQPVLWHRDMSEDEIRISSYGKPIKNGRTYSDGAMAKGMNEFNQRLLDVAHQQNISSIDLAGLYPKNATVFFDYCHYNKTGSKLVSELVLKELKVILDKEKITP